jgi:hypothetical protein
VPTALLPPCLLPGKLTFLSPFCPVRFMSTPSCLHFVPSMSIPSCLHFVPSVLFDSCFVRPVHVTCFLSRRSLSMSLVFCLHFVPSVLLDSCPVGLCRCHLLFVSILSHQSYLTLVSSVPSMSLASCPVHVINLFLCPYSQSSSRRNPRTSKGNAVFSSCRR